MANEQVKKEEVKAPAVGGFDEEETPKAKAAAPKVAARKLEKADDYRPGFNPARAPGHLDPADHEGKRFLQARPGAYVNEAGIVFPQGYQFKGGHVAFDGHAYLNKCPRCGHRMSPDRAQAGMCSNAKANEGNGCGYSALEELEAIAKA